MSEIRIANAPCSWGVMKGFVSEGTFPHYSQVLDEIARSGYAGTELGDWGFMPTDPETLSAELTRRGLAMVGALVPVGLADSSAHADGVRAAVRTARLLAATPSIGGGPFVILADDNGSDPIRRQHAGRIKPEHSLTPAEWRAFAQGAELIARAVRGETGRRTAFHHHCGGFVETPAETESFLDLTDGDLIGLCFDTGHYAYGGGDALDGLRGLGERVWHVHFKDCHTTIANKARSEGWDYFTAVRNGVFYGLGGGEVDFGAILAELLRRDYRGWIVVEDELPPGRGLPLESAVRDREYLRSLGA